METAVFIFIFSAGIAVGALIASKIATYRASRMLHQRGEALRDITLHQWGKSDNDAVIITRMALRGLEH